MSRVGNSVITIPSGVTVSRDGNEITVKGSKGELATSVSNDVVVEISETTQDYLGDWIEASEKGMNEPLWTGFNRSGNVLDPNKPITRMTYGTIIKGWVSEILGIDPSNYNTHSLRRTKASLVYEKTQNIEVVRQLLGQSSVAATSAYLNIGSKDALRVARQVIKL